MTLKRILFVFTIFCIAALCFFKMNMNYNRLSRYSYELTETQQKLILEKLNDNEIEYLIEHSIAPEEYIDFMPYKNFNIYRASSYKAFKNQFIYFSDAQAVNMIEKTLNRYSFEEVIQIMSIYTYEAFDYYLDHGDEYVKEAALIYDPTLLSTQINNETTLSKYFPFSLVNLETVPVLNDKEEVLVDERVVNALQLMCDAIVQDGISKSKCGRLVVTKGYVSYDDQVQLYKEAIAEYGKNDASFYVDIPGHSEHQLGLAIDLAVYGMKNQNFSITSQFIWLNENAHRFGFTLTYPPLKEDVTGKFGQEQHWRYVGVDLATKLFNENITLAEYKHE